MKRIFSLLAGIALLLLSTSAMALPFINGSIDFLGNIMLTGSAPVLTTQNATGIHFINPSLVGTGATGSFAVIPGFPPDTTNVTFSDFTFDPTLSIVNPLWTVTSGSNQFDFDLTSISTTTRITPNGLFIQGAGTLQGSGFADTPGSWTFTTQDAGAAELSFSAVSNSAPVPEPGVVMLLAVGLLAVAWSGKTLHKA
jgi:hypothetical protein